MTCISGKHYQATSADNFNWVILRGSFEMGRFTGSPTEAKLEVEQWDLTVKTQLEQTNSHECNS